MLTCYFQDQMRHELEEELQTEIFPGTEIMADVSHHHFVKSSHGDHSVLVPQPSNVEHDPLVRALSLR